MSNEDVAGCNGILYVFRDGGDSKGSLTVSENEDGMIEFYVSAVTSKDIEPIASLAVSTREFIQIYKEMTILLKSHAECLSNILNNVK